MGLYSRYGKTVYHQISRNLAVARYTQDIAYLVILLYWHFTSMNSMTQERPPGMWIDIFTNAMPVMSLSLQAVLAGRCTVSRV